MAALTISKVPPIGVTCRRVSGGVQKMEVGVASRLVWELVDIAGRKAYHVRLGRLEGTPTNRFGYHDI